MKTLSFEVLLKYWRDYCESFPKIYFWCGVSHPPTALQCTCTTER